MPRDLRIYADNAATSYPKAPGVVEAVSDAMQRLASPGRGAYTEAREAASILHECRSRLCRIINGVAPPHVVFTLNATDAINLGVKGVVRAARRSRPVHVVTTWLDHNSILRPLHELERDGVDVTRLPVDRTSGLIDPAALRAAIRPNTVLVATHHASNVSGTLQPVAEIADVCRARGVALLLDAAQTIGHVPIDVQRLGVDLLAFPGHKGLLGPLGTGALYIRPGFETRMETTREGGTGSLSEQDQQPVALPDRFEAGSHNLPGIAGLNAAVKWIEERTVAELRDHELRLTREMLDGLNTCRHVRLLGPTEPECRVAVFSISLDDWSPIELSEHLEKEFQILSRSGLHCAPLAHRTFGTLDRGGSTRVSLGASNTSEDVDRIVEALHSLRNRPSSRRRAAITC